MGKKTEYWMIITDLDIKKFNIMGPVVDDTAITNQVRKLQDEGRTVECHSILADVSRESLAKSYSEQSQFRFSAKMNILGDNFQAETNTLSYAGSLPAYASSADRRKVVKVLCKGRCKKVRWAEMKEFFPGISHLRESQLGEFQATCLMCGKIALDCYNWTR